MLPRLRGLLLGAGASCEVGMPLVWELTAEFKDWLTPDKLRKFNRAWREQGSGQSDEIIEDAIAVLTRSECHYESILGYLETQYRRPKQGNTQEGYHHLYSWMVQMIYYMLYNHHVRNPRGVVARLSLLDGLARLAEIERPLWIFSLNHDLLVEAVAAKNEVPLNCGFGAKTCRLPRRDEAGKIFGELTAETISADEIERVAFPFSVVGTYGINLLKVHGSLDVFTFNNGKDLLRFLPVESSPSGVFETLRAVNQDLFFPAPNQPDGRGHALNEIAYADATGTMQFLRRTLLAGAFKFDSRRAQVLPTRILDSFRSNLNWVSELICIGYGFGDSHVNQGIRDWLEGSADRVLKIVSPVSKSIPPSFLHLVPQITLIDAKAVDYLDQLSGIARTRLENVERRIAAWARNKAPSEARAEFAAFMEQNYASVISQLGALGAARDPNLESIGNPSDYAKALLAKIDATPERTLEAFVESRIAIAAYERWLARGRADGDDLADWINAARALGLN